MTKSSIILCAASLAVSAIAAAAAPAANPAWGRVTLEASDTKLVAGFNWARKRALDYVFTGDPVGLWYEAALPGRSAFCMRDVSHQSAGARVLGLADANRNMLRHFARSVAASRHWCGYWEIEKSGRPAPVDYKNDSEFWYDLPANFDVLAACYREYLWTGDRAYLDRPEFRNFYDRTVRDFVKTWDQDGDGLLERHPEYGRRILATYNEQFRKHRTMGSDLIASQYAAYAAYAEMQALVEQPAAAREFRDKAEKIQSDFLRTWWDQNANRAYSSILIDGSRETTDVGACFPLWFGVFGTGPKLDRMLQLLLDAPPFNVEEMSYLPEIAYRYGRNARGYELLLALSDPTLKRREYPEVSFAVVGAIASGLMGIQPDARQGVVRTVPRLTGGEAKLSRVPVFRNEIAVAHVGTTQTAFSNQAGGNLRWQAAFPGKLRELSVDGKPVKPSVEQTPAGGWESYVMVDVPAGSTRTVRAVN